MPLTQRESPAHSPSSTPRPCKRRCYHCQRWGHISRGCQFTARCVRCGCEHKSSECVKPADVPAKCANCSSNHPASYRGCPAAPKSRRGRRRPPPCRGCQDRVVDDAPREALSKLVTAITKLLVKKDFFSEEQMAAIAAEIDDRPSTIETSTQSDPEPLPIRADATTQSEPARSDASTQCEDVPTPSAKDAETQTDLLEWMEPPSSPVKALGDYSWNLSTPVYRPSPPVTRSKNAGGERELPDPARLIGSARLFGPAIAKLNQRRH